MLSVRKSVSEFSCGTEFAVSASIRPTVPRNIAERALNFQHHRFLPFAVYAVLPPTLPSLRVLHVRYNSRISPMKPTYSSEPLSQTLKSLVKPVVYIGGFILLAAVAMVGYQSLDESGHISHDQTIDVYMTGDWMVGRTASVPSSFSLTPTGNQRESWIVSSARLATRGFRRTI
jgi:hypothetical protein